MKQKIRHFLHLDDEVAYSNPSVRVITPFMWRILEVAIWLSIILNLFQAVIDYCVKNG